MSNFTIPKGLDFDFKVKVIEEDSFLPQDLTNMDETTSSFTLVKQATPDVSTGVSTLLSVVDAINGEVTGELTAIETDGLEYERGDKVDGYYLKPTYFGVITIKFTDSTPSITTIINDILIVPTGN